MKCGIVVTLGLALLAMSLRGVSLLAAERPNVLFIVSEDNGPELGCYGDRFARTPNLDRLARDGVRFEKAFVPMSVCSPSRAAFLTGLYPHQNGQIGLATHRFAMYCEETPNIVTLLKAAGYHTGLIGKLHVNPEAAFPFDAHAIPGANFDRKQRVEEYAAAAARFLQAAGERPFFLSANYPDAHLPFIRQTAGRPAHPQSAQDVEPMPWTGAESPRLREQAANYYNCLARLDEGVGLLLDALEKSGKARNTLVIYFADHGAHFPRGKNTVYEGGLRVPLIVRWPGHAKPGTVCEGLVSTLDLLPTVLEAAAVTPPGTLPGRALQPWLSGDRPTQWRDYVFATTTGSHPNGVFVQHSIRDKRYKLISNPLAGVENLVARSYLNSAHRHFARTGILTDEQAALPLPVREALQRWSRPPRWELYDLQTDPNEWENLADDPRLTETKSRLIAALDEWQVDTADPFRDAENLNAYVAEQMASRDLPYRKQPGFRWSYLDEFPKWREAFESRSR